jgi:ComEC/Rec2-related protein
LTINIDAVQTSKSTQWEKANGTIEVVTLFNGSSAEDPYGANYGDSVKLYGKLQSPPPTSPKKVIASMSFPRIYVSATDGNAIIASIYHLRNQLATLIEQVLPQPEAALLVGIFLGLQTPALNLLASYFKATGTTHLLVSSGSNVTIISGILSRATQYPLASLPKIWQDWTRTMLLLLGIALYTVLSGAGPATIRAGIMGGLLVIAPSLGKRYNVYTGLAGAALLMSCIDPFLLWDIGFLLSFLATLGIILLTPYLQRLMRPITGLPIESLIIEMTAVTLAAQIATLPILGFAFRQVSLISPIANLLVAPLPGPLILLGLIISVTGLVSHELSLLCGWIAFPLLWYMKTIIDLCSHIPYSFILVEHIPNYIILFYYALLILAISFLLYRYPLPSTKPHQSSRDYKRLYIGTAVLIIVITGIIAILPPSITSNTISFFAIGPTKANEPHIIDATKASQQHIHGEAIFVRTQDGKTLLIDGGNDIVSLSQLLDERLPPWKRSLDMVILTSPQQDTITGLLDVLTRYEIGFVFDAGMAHPSTTYARWRRIINERHLQYTPVAQGTTISLGATAQLQILWPQERLHTGSNEIRDNGLILRLVMPGLRLLLLGSSIQSNYALSGLLTSIDGKMLKADIVQVLGEAGTPVPSALTDLLQHAQPSLVVITSPTQHKSKPPTNNTRATLSSALVSVPQVLETALLGTIEIRTGTNGWTMGE